MSTSTTTLIRDIAAAFVDHPEQIDCRSQASEDAVYFAMRGALADEGKLVGAQGAHVDAMTLLVSEFGKSEGHTFGFLLMTTGTRTDRPKAPERQASGHSPAPAQSLMVRILERIHIGGFDVSVAFSETYVFTIKVNALQDYIKLTVSQPFKRPSGTQQEMSIVGALGTLFRAIARKEGVRYAISVRQEA